MALRVERNAQREERARQQELVPLAKQPAFVDAAGTLKDYQLEGGCRRFCVRAADLSEQLRISRWSELLRRQHSLLPCCACRSCPPAGITWSVAEGASFAQFHSTSTGRMLQLSLLSLHPQASTGCCPSCGPTWASFWATKW